MNKFKLALAAFIAVIGLSVAMPVLASDSVAAQSATDKMKEGINKVGGDQNKTSLEDNIRTVTNVLLFLLGAIAVIMIIIGGIRYATSNGDSSATKAAKDTILYAVIGLIVAILSYAIVNFVIGAFTR